MVPCKIFILTCLRKGVHYLRTQAPHFHILQHTSALPAWQASCLGLRDPETSFVLFFYELLLDSTTRYFQSTLAKYMQIGPALYPRESADTEELQLLDRAQEIADSGTSAEL